MVGRVGAVGKAVAVAGRAAAAGRAAVAGRAVVRAVGSRAGRAVARAAGRAVGAGDSPLALLLVAHLVPHRLASPVAISRTAIAPVGRIAASLTSAQLCAVRCAAGSRPCVALLLGEPALFWVEGWERKAGEWDKCASTPGGVCSALVPRNQILRSH